MKSVMPRKLARHNRSSGAGAQSPKCQQRLLRPPAGAEGRSVSAGRFGYGPAVVVLIVAAVHALAHEFTPQPRPKPNRRRALELLAGRRDGMTEAMLPAHGFMVDILVDLIRAFSGGSATSLSVTGA
jgi:hypothetical protein